MSFKLKGINYMLVKRKIYNSEENRIYNKQHIVEILNAYGLWWDHLEMIVFVLVIIPSFIW